MNLEDSVYNIHVLWDFKYHHKMTKITSDGPIHEILRYFHQTKCIITEFTASYCNWLHYCKTQILITKVRMITKEIAALTLTVKMHENGSSSNSRDAFNGNDLSEDQRNTQASECSLPDHVLFVCHLLLLVPMDSMVLPIFYDLSWFVQFGTFLLQQKTNSRHAPIFF